MGLFLLHVAYLSMSEKFNYGYNMAVCVIAGTVYAVVWTAWSIKVYIYNNLQEKLTLTAGMEEETLCVEMCGGGFVGKLHSVARVTGLPSSPVGR
jgi:hypothetical protein